MSTSDRDDMTTVVMACEEFMASTGIAPERLRELLALGWLESRTEGSDQFFRDADIYRVRKLEPSAATLSCPWWAAPSSWTFWSASTLWSTRCANCRDWKTDPLCREARGYGSVAAARRPHPALRRRPDTPGPLESACAARAQKKIDFAYLPPWGGPCAHGPRP